MAKNQVKTEEVAQENFFTKNWKKICIVVAVIVVIILGIFGYKKLIAEPREAAAADALSTCQTQIKNGEFDKAIVSLKTVADQYGSTKSGNLAQAYLGIAYYNLGKYQDAINALEDFDDCGDNNISPAAEAALGNCYACTKQFDKAVEKLTDAAKKADNASLSPMWMIQAGELYELALNDKAKALEIYNQVKDNYKTSYQVQSGEIDKYIERATVK